MLCMRFKHCTFRGMNNHSSGNAQNGTKVAVECPTEWPIDYFDYDGTEHSIKPPTFSEILAKNAEKIPWRNVVGAMTLLDLDEDDEEEKAATASAKKDEQTAQAIKEQAKEKVEPQAGPWAGVAKSLFQSMQEIDVLLDVLRVSRTNYIKPEQVAPVNNEDSQRANEIQLRAFDDAKRILDLVRQQREQNYTSEKSQFFEELKRMRENWRIRKVNELIFGDLGYRVYGPKFQQSEVFDIFWNPKHQAGLIKADPTTSSSAVQVQVPKHLMRRTYLSVSLLKDSQHNHDRIFSAASQEYQQSQSESSLDIPWDKALEWAQESLICRDIFNQLIKDAVTESHICIVTDNSLVVCMSDGMLLKFEMNYYPFTDAPIPQSGDPYLTMSLRDLFLADVCRARYRSQLFVGVPLTTLPEGLDLRGASGMSAEEIESRCDPGTPLLTRMIRRADHFLLVDRVVELLDRLMLARDDPPLTWKWLRCTSTFSLISCQFFNRFDSMGRVNFLIQVTDAEVLVATKEHQKKVIQCHRQMQLLHETINVLAASCQLYSMSNLARQYGWQVLHANSNAYSHDGTPAPTLYACNQSSSKKMFIQFFADQRSPRIFLLRDQTPPIPLHAMDSEDSERDKENRDFDPNSARFQADEDEKILKHFNLVNPENVPGASFMKKIEFILAMFRN